VIFTFYSYKGGVGRSMALAEVAERLASRGLKVLAIDFDLEAPGLERYFFDAERSRSARAEAGLIDLIQTYRYALTNRAAFEQAEFHKLERFRLRAIHVASSRGGSVDLMTAGRREPAASMAEYAVTVRGFDWQDFFTNWRGDLFFEWLRNELTQGPAAYDVVLVDSRTGVTEMGGVCAYQLADVVVLLCAPNYQNLEGTRDVIRDFLSPGVLGLRRGRPLEIVAVPARIDRQHPRRDEFLAAFARELGVDGMPKRLADSGLDYGKLAVPYLRDYSVAERQVGPLAADADPSTREVFDRLADALTLLAGEGTPLGKLRAEALERLGGTGARAEVTLVADTSRASAGFDVFLDAGPEDRENAETVRFLLEQGGLRVFDPFRDIASGSGSLEAAITALDYSRALAVAFGRASSSVWRQEIVARARRMATVQIVPILLPGGEPTALRSFGLDDRQAIDLRGGPSDGWASLALFRTLLERTDKGAQAGSDSADHAPYPGARPYNEDHANYFAGRDDEIKRLCDALAGCDVVFVSGPAQVGKTSLIRGGLLPRLRQRDPELTEEGGKSIAFLDPSVAPGWRDWYQTVSATSHEPAAGVTARQLVVIDGVDTFLEDGSESAIQQRVGEIVRAIAVAGRRHTLVLAWRDTLDERYRQTILNAASRVRVAHVRVERLTGEALRRAIEQPALRAGHLLEPGLTQRLIESAGGAQSAILQVQLALAAIWSRRQRGWLTNKSLDDAGHLDGIFQGHIDQTLARFSADQRRATEVLCKSLAMLDSRLKLVPVAQFWHVLASVPALTAVDPVALRDSLATAGLIDLTREAVLRGDEPTSTFEVGAPVSSFDTDVKVALVRPNAMVYLGGGEVVPDVRFLMWRRGQFASDLERWLRAGQPRDGLLKGSPLAEAEDWLTLRGTELSGAERHLIEASIALRDRQDAPDAADPVQQRLQRTAHAELQNTTHSVLMLQVDEAMSANNFVGAKTLLGAMADLAKVEAPNRPVDPYIVQRLVLATYKSKQPSELAALKEAEGLLADLQPESSVDPETLGLSSAIHKRLLDLTGDLAHLDQAIRASDRAFTLRSDYYNGINLAFLLNVRAARNDSAADAVTDFVVAERVRREVVSICDRWLTENEGVESASSPSRRQSAEARYWVLATRAEALVGLGDPRAERAVDSLLSAAPSAWMADSTRAQINKLQGLLSDSPLKRFDPSA
jgi:hypothetical protein